ncbi:hypothetical protein NL676_007005 [Syzygium grande]|nr:hypothetical protein NL676_007005 [Syzygium grande]
MLSDGRTATELGPLQGARLVTSNCCGFAGKVGPPQEVVGTAASLGLPGKIPGLIQGATENTAVAKDKNSRPHYRNSLSTPERPPPLLVSHSLPFASVHIFNSAGGGLLFQMMEQIFISFTQLQ